MLKIDFDIPGGPVLLAVSGGADSIVMASLFRRDALCRFAIAHCNFRLRGQESDDDEAFVRKWAADNGVECFVKSFDTKTYALQKSISIEMAARELRYAWFDSLCREKGFQGVCVAHNADDNAETLLLNLVRGTGLKGICGIAPESRNPFGETRVFRPMLGFARAQIEEYAAKHGISYRTDSTNAVSDCRRNIVRNRIFPILKEMNPSVVTTLNADISHFRQIASIVEKYAAEGLCRDGRIVLEELKGRADWKYSLHSALSVYGFNSSTVNDVAALLESDGIISGRKFFSPGYRLVTTTDALLVQPLEAEHSRPYIVERLPWKKGDSPVTGRGMTIMDAASFGAEGPVLRKWRDGDYLYPLGLRGRKKVSDILTDLKYDLIAKEGVLVVEGEGSRVLAVVGERIDESVRVTPSTTEIYRISIQ